MNITIVVADDDTLSRTMLAGTLISAGYAVIEATDGIEAEQFVLAADTPVLLVLDWEMPQLSGIDLCTRFKDTPPSMPIYTILLTGKDHVEDMVHGLDSGADDYIKKPYDANELRARIRVGFRMLTLQSTLISAKKQLQYQATHDPLTGILNRGAIMEALSREWSRYARNDTVFTIGFFDIDHFKNINDTYGHSAGDAVLKMVCTTIEQSLREYDFFGRYGGEEFLLLAPATVLPDHANLYERIRLRIQDTPFETATDTIPITVSIGIAASSEVQTVDALISLADTRLYKAKESGRNRVLFQ